MTGNTLKLRIVHCLIAAAALLLFAASHAPAASAKTNTYENPLLPVIPGDGVVESCADPALIRGQTFGDPYWYAYCTTDPLNGQDRTAGALNFHLIPILRSLDLVNWTYVGDAFAQRPSWVTGGPWAPDIAFFNGLYHLYYAAPDTTMGGSAIGVATSASPTGPFVDQGVVVEPHAADCCPGSRRWVFDPDFIEVGGVKYIFYGSYFGGISARRLSPDGLRSDPASQVQIAIANRYEGAHVVEKDGWFYLFVSATDCCRGALTGYSVFVGRSRSVLGPYVDREGVSFLAGRVGGTPFLSMNGNAFVGPGHNFVLPDAEGQWWTFYHAINRFDPYFAGAPGFTKRPLMLDAVDWIDGWPTVRGGYWISDKAQHGPAAQPGEKSNYSTPKFKDVELGKLIPELTDEFDSLTLSPQWSWVRAPAPGTYSLTGSTLRWDTQVADLTEGSNNASVLVERAPKHDYVVETKVQLNLPPEGCCFNWTQAGSVIYGNDDNFIKLVHVSIFETRQTEFAKETQFPAEWHPTPGGPRRYGNTVVGPPSDWTYLRIAFCSHRGTETYTPYTSTNGTTWVRGGTWTHSLGDAARIGLVSMGRLPEVRENFTANFDYVRVYRAHGCTPSTSGSGR